MDMAIAISGLKKSFGERVAIEGLDLTIATGTTYGLIGPNGAGKTTLFRLLVGLQRPNEGTVKIWGRDVCSTKINDSIGYMTQAEALYDDLSVAENIGFFGKIYGLRGKVLEEAVERALDLVKLSDRMSSKIRELSGGMRRRASLACAVVHRPKLLLLDEPTVGVDPELRAEFWDTFVRWGKEGVTIIVSTHHLDEAGRCAKLGLMRAGRLIAEGSVDALLHETSTKTVEEAFLAFARRER